MHGLDLVLVFATSKCLNSVSHWQMTLSNPFLSESELELLEGDPIFQSSTLPVFFDISNGIEGSLQRALDNLCEAADEAVRAGSQLLILSDRSDDMVS